MAENPHVHDLLRLFDSLSLTEMTYKDKDIELSVKKGMAPVAGVQAAVVLEKAAVQAPQVQAAPQATPAPATQTPVTDPSLTEVKSPLVGTFYLASAPGQPPFVEVGKSVKKGAPLCIVEAMKMMNTIEADCDGTVEKIVATNGDVVEFGAPLFLIRTA